MTIQSSEMQDDVYLNQIEGIVYVSTKYRETWFTFTKTAGLETTSAMEAEPKFREKFEKREEKTKM